MLRVNMAGCGDMAGYGLRRDEVRGKARRCEGAESKYADKRARGGKCFHRGMFLRPRFRFNRSRSLPGGFFAAGARFPSRSGAGCVRS